MYDVAVAAVLFVCVGPVLASLGAVEPALEPPRGSRAARTASATWCLGWARRQGAIAFMVDAVLAASLKAVVAHERWSTRAPREPRPHRRVVGPSGSRPRCCSSPGPRSTEAGQAHRRAAPGDRLADLLCLGRHERRARVYSQYFFLQQTSAASLAVAGIAIEALTSALGIAIFDTRPTLLLVAGVVLTVAATSLYAWLRHAEPRASHRTTQGEVQSGS